MKVLATRRTLLTRLKDWEDEESWREFFDTYWKLIYGFALRSGLSDAEAQDVVQETLLAVAKRMPGFHYDPAVGSFRSWLLHTTQWRIRDQLRKRQRDHRLERSLAAQATVEATVAESAGMANADWDREWEVCLYEAALRRLKRRVSSKQYQMFHLFGVKGLPVSAVTRRLGVSRTQVYVAKHRVQRLLAQEIRSLEKNMT